jgi:hypothetical protein
MYHFPSGRQDFNNLPYNGAEAIKNSLQFNFENTNHGHHLSFAELQEFVLKAHIIDTYGR